MQEKYKKDSRAQSLNKMINQLGWDNLDLKSFSVIWNEAETQKLIHQIENPESKWYKLFKDIEEASEEARSAVFRLMQIVEYAQELNREKPSKPKDNKG